VGLMFYHELEKVNVGKMFYISGYIAQTFDIDDYIIFKYVQKKV